MPRYLNQNKREDLYWIVALKDKLETSRQFYKGKELTWLDSILLSCDIFAQTVLKGIENRELKTVLNFAGTVRPILYTDKLYTEETHLTDIIKCDSSDIYGVSEFALEYCKTSCEGDFTGCKLRKYLENLQVPPWVDIGPCPYFRREEW